MMATARDPEEYELPPIIELTDAEARRIFDDRARESFGISGDEFVRKWDAGEFEGRDEPDVIRMALMLPLMGRPFLLADNRSWDEDDYEDDADSLVVSNDTQHTHSDLPSIVRLTDAEARELFDRQTRKHLNMSGEEFLCKWDAGEIEDPDQSHIIDIVMMIPMLGRPIVMSDEQ